MNSVRTFERPITVSLIFPLDRFLLGFQLISMWSEMYTQDCLNHLSSVIFLILSLCAERSIAGSTNYT